MQERRYRFFQHRTCEYFPCHTGIPEDSFNCLFCYCPLYVLGKDCGGTFSYENPNHIKDCSGCTLPHRRESYDRILRYCRIVIERFGTEKSCGNMPAEWR